MSDKCQKQTWDFLSLEVCSVLRISHEKMSPDCYDDPTSSSSMILCGASPDLGGLQEASQRPSAYWVAIPGQVPRKAARRSHQRRTGYLPFWRRLSPMHMAWHAKAGLSKERDEAVLALLGRHHIDTSRHSRHVLAATSRALRFCFLMLGDGLGTLERPFALCASILIGWHGSGPSLSGHLRQSLTPSCRGSSSFRRMKRRAGSLIVRCRASRRSTKAQSRPHHPAPRKSQ